MPRAKEIFLRALVRSGLEYATCHRHVRRKIRSKHKSTSLGPCRHTYVLSALLGSCCGNCGCAYVPVLPSRQRAFTWSQKGTAANGTQPSGGRWTLVARLSGAWNQSDSIAFAEGGGTWAKVTSVTSPVLEEWWVGGCGSCTLNYTPTFAFQFKKITANFREGSRGVLRTIH